MNGGPGGAAGGGVACCAAAGMVTTDKRKPRESTGRRSIVLMRMSSLFICRILPNSVSGNLAHKLVLQFAASCKRRAGLITCAGSNQSPRPLQGIAPRGRFMLKMSQYLRAGCSALGMRPSQGLLESFRVEQYLYETGRKVSAI